MKKLILIFTVLAFSITVVNAQEFARFGLKGGLNVSNYTGEFKSVEGNAKGRIAYHVGLLAEFQIFNQFSIQPEFLYSVQPFTISGIDHDRDTKFKIDNLVIPLIMKFNVSKNLNIETGPQMSFLINHKMDLIRRGSYDNLNKSHKSNEVSVVLGSSYEINNIFLFGRYSFGLTDMYNYNDYIDLKNSVIQLGVGYLF